MKVGKLTDYDSLTALPAAAITSDYHQTSRSHIRHDFVIAKVSADSTVDVSRDSREI